jgi:hypothetical protein
MLDRHAGERNGLLSALPGKLGVEGIRGYVSNISFCARLFVLIEMLQYAQPPNYPLTSPNHTLRISPLTPSPANIDEDMMIYLKKWFPEEVKAKQKYNAHMAGVDQYGEAYNTRCTVM